MSKRKQFKKPITEIEKYQAYGDPFYSRSQRHFRGHKTSFGNVSPIHPSLIVGEWPNDYLSMGGQSVHGNKDLNAKQRKKLIPTPQNRNKKGEETAIRKEIEVRNKKFYSDELYTELYLTDEQHLAVDKRVASKRKFYEKGSRGQPANIGKQQVGNAKIKPKTKMYVKKKKSR